MKTAVAFDGAAIDSLRRFAEEPANLHDLTGPGEAPPAPGANPNAVREVDVAVANPRVGTFRQRLRVVFSITRAVFERLAEDGAIEYVPGVFRVASFSLVGGEGRPGIPLTPGVDARNDLPAPSAVEAVCLGLGFRGRLNTWTLLDAEPGVIMLAQAATGNPSGAEPLSGPEPGYH